MAFRETSEVPADSFERKCGDWLLDLDFGSDIYF
jgi:hypothetical protein